MNVVSPRNSGFKKTGLHVTTSEQVQLSCPKFVPAG